MSLSKKTELSSIPWFTVGMALVLLLSLALHFWDLDRFNTLVFDEVYYVKYANNYLTRTPFFDAHPPLGKYAIALAISIGSYFGGGDEINNLGGVSFSPWTYRWLNALIGSVLPLVVGAIAYHLTHRRSYALIAALFATLDGLLLVESRYALINIYLVFFGLLGHWFFLLALEHIGKKRWFWLALSGISLGCCISVKWNGLGFLSGIYLIWIFAWVIEFLPKNNHPWLPLQKLTQIKLYHLVANLAILPAIVYYLIWIPHLQINRTTGFLELHQQILGFHRGLASGPSVHPYCSSWYTWPWMVRPMSYFYETTRTISEPVPSFGPSLPAGAGKIVYDVHAMGNPFLWWFSTAAIIILLIELSKRIWLVFKTSETPYNYNFFHSPTFWISFYLLVNYGANFLPWIKVTRCTFIYLYMAAAVFGFMSLALLVDRWLISPNIEFRAIGVTAIFLIVFAFVVWLPVYLGLPLSTEGFAARMWLRSWY